MVLRTATSPPGTRDANLPRTWRSGPSPLAGEEGRPRPGGGVETDSYRIRANGLSERPPLRPSASSPARGEGRCWGEPLSSSSCLSPAQPAPDAGRRLAERLVVRRRAPPLL